VAIDNKYMMPMNGVDMPFYIHHPWGVVQVPACDNPACKFHKIDMKYLGPGSVSNTGVEGVSMDVEYSSYDKTERYALKWHYVVEPFMAYAVHRVIQTPLGTVTLSGMFCKTCYAAVCLVAGIETA